jgi:uncharacterized membrane protein
MADGTTKPIEDIKAGDKVIATDPTTGKTTARKVLAPITSKSVKNLARVTVGNGDNAGVLTATGEHPFWVPTSQQWQQANTLWPGQYLRTGAGTYVQVSAITTWTSAEQRVHNLTVADTHTYYVLAGATPVLVHNSNDCPTSLYHYTNEAGHDGIISSGELRASLKADNPKDARYGDGQYLTDIKPGTKRPGQLSAAFLRVPWAGRKFTHYIEIDVKGLDVVEGRPGVFVVPNSGPLDLTGRILGSGRN